MKKTFLLLMLISWSLRLCANDQNDEEQRKRLKKVQDALHAWALSGEGRTYKPAKKTDPNPTNGGSPASSTDNSPRRATYKNVVEEDDGDEQDPSDGATK